MITAPDCLEELYALSSRDIREYIEMIPIDPMYRLRWEDGHELNYTRDLERMNQQIALRDRRDVDGYRRFLDFSQAVFEEGYVKLAATPFLSFSSMIRVAPQLIRLESYRSVYSIVKRYVNDPHLRQALSYHTLLVGGNPFTASSIYALIHALEREWGVFFRQGRHARPGAGAGAPVRRSRRRTACRQPRGTHRDPRGGRVTGVALAGGGSLRGRRRRE